MSKDGAGGFFTGIKGIALLVLGLIVLIVIAVTGVLGSRNTYPRLQEASTQFTGNTTFGTSFFGKCITENATYPDGSWQATFDVNGKSIRSVALTDSKTVSELSGLPQQFKGKPVRFSNRPEVACYSICQEQLGRDGCTFFTYDGITKDSCRFVAKGASPPRVQTQAVKTDAFGYAEGAAYSFIYDGACMFRERKALLDALNAPPTGLVRPSQGGPPLGQSAPAKAYDSLLKSFVFFRLQWAGSLPEPASGLGSSFRNLVSWRLRRPGFVDLDKDTCKGNSYDTSFANGNHIVSTMAVAEQTALLGLAATWWTTTYKDMGDGLELAKIAIDELERQGKFLNSAWESSSRELLIGIGDQLNQTDNSLLTYSDFADAPNALAVGGPDESIVPPENDAENVTAQGLPKLPVKPECSWADERSQPAADVAAHTAAALTLAYSAISNLSATGEEDFKEWLTTAEELLEYSTSVAPFKGASFEQLKSDAAAAVDVAQQSAGPDENVQAATNFGATQMYGSSKADNVFAHQLWAACTLYQATNETKYWDMAESIYKNLIVISAKNETDFRLDRLYFPVANYDNPIFYGLMCMAQSAPEATGLENRPDLEFQTGDQADTFINNQDLWEVGSRLEVTNNLLRYFVSPWIAADRTLPLVKSTPNDPDQKPPPITFSGEGGIRYASINDTETGEVLGGLFRDAANAAWIALMYADLPVTEENKELARCMAYQTLSFITGTNSVGDSGGFTFQVGLEGCKESGTCASDVYSKDAACPDGPTLEERTKAGDYPGYYVGNTGSGRDERGQTETQVCDATTFNGRDENGTVTYFPNFNELTGALVSKFDPLPGADPAYNDRKVDLALPEAEQVNDQTFVGIDFNAALANAALGLAALPDSFDPNACPNIETMRQRLKASADDSSARRRRRRRQQ